MKFSSLVCFAGGDWWYHHPHSYNHLMRQFAKDVKVLYVNSLPVGSLSSGKSGKRALNKLKSILRFFKKAEENLFVFTPFFIPMKESGILLEINTILLRLQVFALLKLLRMKDPLFWITNPNGYIFLRGVKKAKSVYQIVDKVSAYKHAGKAMAHFDAMLCERSDAIFTPGRVLFEEKKNIYQNKVFRIKHGVDTEHFSKQSAIKPSDFPANNKKTFTYWGSIDYKKVDYNLLKHLGENASAYNILLLGRVFDFEANDFSKYTNIHFLGEKSFSCLYEYASFSDGFLIPWDRDDEMNRNASPIKIREYLSTGKPVIATYIPEFDEFKDYIYISRTNEDFVRNMKLSLQENSNDKSSARIDFVKSSSWRKVYEEIIEALGSVA